MVTVWAIGVASFEAGVLLALLGCWINGKVAK
jgi:hypothetical protein